LFILVFVVFGLLAPRFFAVQNFENIVKQASFIGIVAVGMTFVLLTAGIDLSVGTNMYISALAAGLLMKNYHVHPALAFLACLGVGTLFGAVNAFFITKLKIIPFIVTLATLPAGRGLALYFSQSVAVPYPQSVLQLRTVELFGLIPLPIVVFLVVVAAAYIFLNMTPLGRQIYAVGNDIEAAKKAGINTDRVLATVYIICGLLAALGGFVSVGQLGIVNPAFGEGREFDAIAAAVLGGTSLFGGVGSVFPGTVIGAVLIQMIQTGLIFTKVDLYQQPLVTAGIIFFAVFLDAVRNTQLAKLRRRNIRTERVLTTAAPEGAGG
jgi:ribose/xylose/arabinose/galactoside ABC-type transport system permease subunit